MAPLSQELEPPANPGRFKLYGTLLAECMRAFPKEGAFDRKSVRDSWVLHELFNLACHLGYPEVMREEIAELPVCMDGVALDDRTVGVEWSLLEATTVMSRISSSKSDKGKIVLRRLGDVIGDTVVLAVTLPAPIFEAAQSKRAAGGPEKSMSKSVYAAIEEAYRAENAKNHVKGPVYASIDDIPF